MKTSGQPIIRHLIIVWGLLICAVFNSAQAAITPAQKPLYVGISAAKPNIMLMIDSSGSMTTEVTTTSTISSPSAAPSTFSYTCSKAISGGVTPPGTPATPIYMTVTAMGVVKVCTNTSCSKSTNFSRNSCFSNNKNYNVAYYSPASLLSGGPYTGLQLNWYFSQGSFNAGSLAATATTIIKRTVIAKQAATDLMTALTPDTGSSATVRMGLAKYNYDSGGSLLSEIKDLDLTQSTHLQAQIANIQTSDWTPLAETLSDIGKYFAMGETSLILHPKINTASTPVGSIFGTATNANRDINNATGNSTLGAPILGYCQKSFVILISDGLPSKDRAISSYLRDYTGDCAKTPPLCDSTSDENIDLPGVSTPLESTGSACNNTHNNSTKHYTHCKNGTKVGRSYETEGGSDYLDDVAQALYEMDLRPSLEPTQKANTHTKNNVVTYAIGFADPNLQTTPPSILSDAATVGGGKFFFAADSKALAAALDETIADISSQVGSSSSVAANSSKLESGSIIYQAKFDSANWIGSFTAFPLGASEDVNGNGILDSSEDTNGNGILDAGGIGAKIWDAAEHIPAFGARNIYTYNSATTPKGVLFACANLTASQKTALGITTCASTDVGVWRLEYIRGDGSHEATNPNRKDTDTIRTGTNLIFRNRTYLDRITGTTNSPDPWVLGDIVNSDPVYVGNEDYGYDKLTGSEGTTYKAFVTSNASRRKMIYVGANDGMLHGFDAGSSGADAGKEILAYVPNAVYSGLNALSSPGYTHQYLVDGSPRVADAYFGGVWHTLLVGTTGAGGHSVFGLDVSDPSNFDGSKVLWEISDADSPVTSDRTTDTTAIRGFGNNLGYTLPQPSIVKMQDGSWAAIVANGYASNNNLAVLYIINVQTGQLIRALDTQAGGAATPNGLSTPIAVDTNNDKMTDVIYAGDLLGNLWEFDVSSTTSGNWNIANTGAPLFVACSDANNCNTTRQSITAKPQVGAVGSSQTSGVMVYFGTGKYFEDVDNNVTNAQTQTFYGIWDNNAVVSRSNLQQQSIIAEVTSGSFNLRATSDNTVNYATKKGWYMDLLPPSATASIGERVVSAPLLRNGQIIFVTLIPIPPVGNVADVCGAAAGTTSWLMELDAITGKRLVTTAAGGGAPWDINGDGVINISDLITVNGQSIAIAPSGKQSTVGGVKTPGVISNGLLEYKYTSGTKEGELEMTTEKGGGGGSSTSTGSRQSWRQLFQ
ncbi:MAG: PilC/PilY family type IV pilus protein [Methylococcaceae bacterium]